MHQPRALFTLWFALLPACAAIATDPVRTDGPHSGNAASSSVRVVHRFDFDERAEGNLEDIPKYWTPIHPRGFPGFSTGGFDFDIGRLAPPSFYLASSGRNVAYHYSGPDTRIRRNVEYRIEGFVHPGGLNSARACLSAHYLDKSGNPILSTLVRSRYLGGLEDGNRWSKVELYLPTAPPEAFTVGLMVWVLQEPMWKTSALPRRHISEVDVHAGAWFDDITIHALPRVEISTSSPSNVLPANGPQELAVIFADADSSRWVGRLSILAADGVLIETHTITAATEKLVTPIVISVDHLVPGLYEAQLDVLAGETVVTSRRLAFARLAPMPTDEQGKARPFGVVIRPEVRAGVEKELALLREQAARSVQLPVWAGLAETPVTPTQRRATDRLLRGLVKDGFALTAVFYGPPGAVARPDGPYRRPLIELLHDPPEVWRDRLAAMVAPYASVFRWWQVGPCADYAPAEGDRLTRALENLRTLMRRFVPLPQLALPAASSIEPHARKWPVEQVALTLGHEIQPAKYGPLLERFRSLGCEHVSAYVAPLSANRYLRLPRLADWARRIITARFEGADTVFVPQPWHIRETPSGPVIEPDEEYIILRTIAGTIAGAQPGQRVPIAPDVQCLAFHEGQSTTLALWDAQAPPEGRSYAIQLGSATEWVDLWGRAAPLDRDRHGRQIVTLSFMPILIPRVERWLIDFRTSVVLRPAQVESGTELARHTIELVHHGPTAIAGSMYLAPPQSWEVTPHNHNFTLIPRQTERLNVEVRYPHNEVAGVRPIRANIALLGNSYYLEVPLSVEVGLKGVNVSGMAVIEEGDLVVQHIVTNQTESILHFRGAAQVRGRQRQYRPLANLSPGATQMVEYRFANAQDLAGARVLVGLREMNDGPRAHTLELLVP